jgi:phospholipase/lecithinase/hemolysin
MAVFGDSFSDVGNVYIKSNGTQPGIWSYNGRYSDGRVWGEYLQQFFGLPTLLPSLAGGSNYAYGGATVNNAYIHAYSTALEADVPSVCDQIDQYLQDESVISNTRLHIVSAAYNDYWWYVNRNYTTSDGQDFNLTNVYTTVANDVVKQVGRLYNDGARMFLVGNVPNMSSFAEAALLTQEILNAYDVLVEGHNKLLKTLLSGFEEQHDDVTMYHFDAFDIYDCINEQKEFFGIENVHDPCHPSENDDCGAIFSYKFWDYYHPTTHAHQIASVSVLQSIYNKETEKAKALSKTSLRKTYKF